MLRALTSYFFGGIEDETPEAPIECETREVNDWLVVNLPDQNKDSINLNDDDDTYEIDNEDIRNESDEDDLIEVDACYMKEMDSDEDDILLSVSFLMMSTDAETFSSELSDDEMIESGVLEHHPFQSFPIISPIQSIVNSFWGEYDRDTFVRLRVKQLHDFFVYEPARKVHDIEKEALIGFLTSRKCEQWKHCNGIVSEFERKDKILAELLELTPPPMHSKNYVNHRHPEKLLNHDLLQRIKELEPEQQAVQRSIKKTFTRGQFNRQNKNYMYETSSKRNRRSNRQRNHSGANNNRKC